MAITFETVQRNAIADALELEISFGVTQSGGKLVIEQSNDSEISLHRFDDPFSAAASSGTITMTGAPKDDTSATAGTAAQFSIYDRNDLKILEGIVNVTGDELDLSSLSVGAGDTVSLTAFSITAPA